jgi:hypothetical protein
VEAQISDTRAKVLKAQESVSSAIEKREQFYKDYKESKLKELKKEMTHWRIKSKTSRIPLEASIHQHSQILNLLSEISN